MNVATKFTGVRSLYTAHDKSQLDMDGLEQIYIGTLHCPQKLKIYTNGPEKASMFVVIGHGNRHFNTGAYGAVCG